MWSVESPEAVGLSASRWQSVCDLARRWCEEDQVPSLGMVVGQDGRITEPAYFGRHRLDKNSPPIKDDALFLVASITKPVVATGILLLVERGLLTLNDRVVEFVPEFAENGKVGVMIRHLLTHTSGLPDMLPNNRDLRMAHCPMSVFVDDICACELDFPPGRAVQYQSMGFAMLGEIARRVTGRSCSEFLKRELFQSLHMKDTVLGTPEEWWTGESPTVNRIAEVRRPASQPNPSDWDWNSRYWRCLGAPWGGLITTPLDLARLAGMMLDRGRFDNQQILSPPTVRAATRNQLSAMRDVSEADRRTRRWGLGWRLSWPADSDHFGDLLSDATYGHWGATGTLIWIDPQARRFAVILTTQPQAPRGRFLARLSNAICAAFEE